MGGKFHFVEGIGADRASKRLMRRHVMKGKNAGKTLHRPSRRTNNRHRASEAPTPGQEDEGARRTLLPLTASSRYFGDKMLTLSTPVVFTAYTLGVVNLFFSYVADRIYPIQLGLTIEDAKRLWFQLLHADEATYHCSIVLLQACNEIFQRNGKRSPEALYHLSQAYSHIKKRLQGPDALSDSTIGLVMFFIHQEQIQCDRSHAKVHVDGMRRMIELRGGLGQIEENVPLTLKVCKTDVIFTLQYGGPTAFFRDRMPRVKDAHLLEGYQLEPNIGVVATLDSRLNPDLDEILADVFYISALFNKQNPKHTTSLIVYQEMVLSILYRLIRFQPLDAPQRGSDLDAVYHVGSTIFIMTIFLQFQHRRVIDHRLTVRRLRVVLDTAAARNEGSLALWLMVVGGIWIWDSDSGKWLSPKLMDLAQRMKLDTWDEACSVLRTFPWINCIHDGSGQKVWERVHRTSTIQ